METVKTFFIITFHYTKSSVSNDGKLQSTVEARVTNYSVFSKEKNNYNTSQGQSILPATLKDFYDAMHESTSLTTLHAYFARL